MFHFLHTKAPFDLTTHIQLTQLAAASTMEGYYVPEKLSFIPFNVHIA